MARPRTPAGRARSVVALLADEYPGGVRDLCELDFETPWQLLVATVLSAQTTDVSVNAVTPDLFARWPEPADLAAAEPAEVEEVIHRTGFFRAKTRSVIGLAAAVEERFGGEVPSALSDLVTLPGVGRKTGNVVRSVAFDQPGLPVDTHVTRLANLLGLTTESDPVRIESDLCGFLPRRDWGTTSLRIILHGRRVCVARRPRCGGCVLAGVCPSVQLPTPSGVSGRPRPSPAAARLP